MSLDEDLHVQGVSSFVVSISMFLLFTEKGRLSYAFIFNSFSVKDVPQDKMEVLCKFIEKRSVNRGEPIFLQGELGSHFFFVMGGSVRVYAEKNHHVAMQRLREIKEVGNALKLDLNSGMLGQHITTYGANDGFGELSLSGSNPMRNGEPDFPLCDCLQYLGRICYLIQPCFATASAIADRHSTVLMLEKQPYMQSLAHVHKKQLMMAEKLNFLPTVAVFADWARTRLVQLAYLMVEIEVERSSVIFQQDAPCDCLLILKEGSVKEVVKAPPSNPYKNQLTHRMGARDIEIGLRTPGSFLGEVS